MENSVRQPIVETLMKRDGISREEATKIRNDLKAQALDLVEEGSLFEIEDLIMDEIGLEPDYLDELIF
jgi:hypothetical protein